MPVLIEAISIVIRRDAIKRRFIGGWDAFVKTIPNNTLCKDENLLRVGFMTPKDVEAYVELLELNGLVFKEEGCAVDLAVVDQLKGPTVNAPWLEVGRFKNADLDIMIGSFKGAPRNGIALPAQWKFEGSISQESQYAPSGADDDRLSFLRREGNTDVYKNLITGKEVYVGRPPVEGDSGAALFKRLETMMHETLDLDTQMQPLRALGDTEALSPLVHKLQNEFLPETVGICANHGKDLAFAHFTRGVILRVLGAKEDAIEAQLHANHLQSGVINILLELVRCYGEMKRDELALPYAREATEVEPTSAAAWGNLASCLISLGERDEARKALDFALDLEPGDPINRTLDDNFDSYFNSTEEA